MLRKVDRVEGDDTDKHGLLSCWILPEWKIGFAAKLVLGSGQNSSIPHAGIEEEDACFVGKVEELV